MKWVLMGLAIGFGILVLVSTLTNSLIFVIACGMLSISYAVLSAGNK